MKIIPLIPFFLFLVAGPCPAATQPADAPDKSNFGVFNPVPDHLLRDFDTDRPDKTNSPHTLDAGRFQLEMGWLAFTRNQDAGTRTDHWTWADTTLRLGLTNWAELQLEIPCYQSNCDTDLASQMKDNRNGIGDLSVMLKTNCWGNDNGDTAGGLELFVKTPTATHNLGNGKYEGGAVFLFGMKLPGDFDLGINNGVSINANDDGGYHAEIINSISISHGIVGPLAAYVEFYSSVPTQHSSDWQGTVDLGLLFMIGKNFQLDGGINIGVTHAADDIQPFTGMSYRF